MPSVSVDTIKRRSDGSIATEHYMKRGERLRGALIQATFRSAIRRLARRLKKSAIEAEQARPKVS